MVKFHPKFWTSDWTIAPNVGTRLRHLMVGSTAALTVIPNQDEMFNTVGFNNVIIKKDKSVIFRTIQGYLNFF